MRIFWQQIFINSNNNLLDFKSAKDLYDFLAITFFPSFVRIGGVTPILTSQVKYPAFIVLPTRVIMPVWGIVTPLLTSSI